MIRALAPVAALLVGVAILLTGQGLQGMLLPFRANLEDFSVYGVGFIGATYFLGFTLGCLLGARMIRRVGHVRVFAAMTAAASAAPLLHGLWINIWSWAVLRMVSGFCFAILYMVIESWINEKASNENRGTIFSAYVLINMTVLAVGQQMLLLADPRSMTLFVVASVLVSLATLPVALSNSELPREVQVVKLDISYLYHTSPAGMLGALATGLANGSFWALAPIFGAAYSNDASVAAWVMTASVLGGVAGQWPLGRLSDRIDRRYVMGAISLGGMGVATAIWAFAGSLPTLGVILLCGLWGAMAFPLNALAVAHANDYANPDEYVMLSSGLLLMYGIGAVVGPFIASAAMGLMGPGGLYVFTAIVHGLLLVYILNRTIKRRPSPAEEHVPFDDALTAARTTSQVYEEGIENEGL
jgi:MFS family permease